LACPECGGVNNTWLYQQHAKAVANYIRPLLRGKKLVMGWYASSKPIATETSKAGLQEGQRMHVLRHTCVSLLISQGVNIKAIQAWVGHSYIVQTLDTYDHLFPDSMSELADKLDEYALLAASDVFIRMVN
jgi:integrase